MKKAILIILALFLIQATAAVTFLETKCNPRLGLS